MYSFEGTFKRKREINLSGQKRVGDRATLLQQAQEKRKQRELQRRQIKAAQTIQVCM
jgi:ubiquitin-protein ligase E3 C